LLESLADGASEQSLSELESKLGVKLPEEFREGWMEHNGQRLLPNGDRTQSVGPLLTMMEFMGVVTSFHEWEGAIEYCDEDGLEAEAEGPVKAMWWNRSWIPIVLIGGETRFFCLDMDPAEGGEVGQIIHATPKWEERRVVAPSINAFFDLIAEAIEKGEFEVVDGEIDVCDVLGI
jgi:cell wall assembly regulator SMI1